MRRRKFYSLLEMTPLLLRIEREEGSGLAKLQGRRMSRNA